MSLERAHELVFLFARDDRDEQTAHPAASARHDKVSHRAPPRSRIVPTLLAIARVPRIPEILDQTTLLTPTSDHGIQRAGGTSGAWPRSSHQLRSPPRPIPWRWERMRASKA